MIHPLQDVAALSPLGSFINKQKGVVDVAVSVRPLFDYVALYGKLGYGLVNFGAGCVFWVHRYSLSIIISFDEYNITEIIKSVYKIKQKKTLF